MRPGAAHHERLDLHRHAKAVQQLRPQLALLRRGGGGPVRRSRPRQWSKHAAPPAAPAASSRAAASTRASAATATAAPPPPAAAATGATIITAATAATTTQPPQPPRTRTAPTCGLPLQQQYPSPHNPHAHNPHLRVAAADHDKLGRVHDGDALALHGVDAAGRAVKHNVHLAGGEARARSGLASMPTQMPMHRASKHIIAPSASNTPAIRTNHRLHTTPQRTRAPLRAQLPPPPPRSAAPTRPSSSRLTSSTYRMPRLARAWGAAVWRAGGVHGRWAPAAGRVPRRCAGPGAGR